VKQHLSGALLLVRKNTRFAGKSTGHPCGVETCMKYTFRYVLSVATICFCFPVSAQQPYKQYCNARFGYCLEYPAMLAPGPEAPNGDGRVFLDRRKAERLRVYGTGNWNFNDAGTPISLAQLFNIELRGGRFPAKPARVVTYSALKKDWFVLSGTVGNEIFYLKVIAKDDAFCYAWLRYPKADSAAYNPVSGSIASSFR
jgi:hypothetical protein